MTARHEKMCESVRFCSQKVFAKLGKYLAKESYIYKEKSLNLLYYYKIKNYDYWQSRVINLHVRTIKREVRGASVVGSQDFQSFYLFYFRCEIKTSLSE